MAQRLATDYVKTCLQLTKAEMFKFITFFQDQQIKLQVKVYDNGSKQVVFHDEAGEEFVLNFDRKHNGYVCEGSCRLSSPRLVNAMRKAVSSFKGDAVVHRIYSTYTVVYYYTQGNVAKIVELRDNQEKIIYEYKDTLGQLEQLFYKRHVEEQIAQVQHQINGLLDLRVQTKDRQACEQIDRCLHKLTHTLFVLEA